MQLLTLLALWIVPCVVSLGILLFLLVIGLWLVGR